LEIFLEQFEKKNIFFSVLLLENQNFARVRVGPRTQKRFIERIAGERRQRVSVEIGRAICATATIFTPNSKNENKDIDSSANLLKDQLVR
jgi:hypothetical protein